jgi:hypothetical protein
MGRGVFFSTIWKIPYETLKSILPLPIDAMAPSGKCMQSSNKTQFAELDDVSIADAVIEK